MNFKIFDRASKIMSEIFEVSELTDWKLIWGERFNGLMEVSFSDLVWLKGSGKNDVNEIEMFEGDLITMKSYNYSFLNTHMFVLNYNKEEMRFEFQRVLGI